MSISDMLRIRDNNLVAMIRALKGQDFGAGTLMNGHEAGLREGIILSARVGHIDDISQPLMTVRRVVPLDWTDYNGHMNEAKYLQAFGDATDRFMEMVGCDADYIATGGSYFIAETHIRHVDEAQAGALIEARTQVLMGAVEPLPLNWSSCFLTIGVDQFKGGGSSHRQIEQAENPQLRRAVRLLL